MNVSSGVIVNDPPHLGFVQRGAIWLACGVSGWIFYSLGWDALRPLDPLAPVSLVTHSAPVFMLLMAAVLASIAAALGSVIAGRWFVDVGTLAAALGVAITSLRGDTAEFFVLEGSEIYPDTHTLALRFLLEMLAWSAVMVVAILISGAVSKWVRSNANAEQDHLPPLQIGDDIPRTNKPSSELRTPVSVGVKHTAVVTIVGLIVFSIVSFAGGGRIVQHGQAAFTIAVSIAAACYAAFRFAPVRSALWSLLGVLVIGLVGYLWAAIATRSASLPPTIPSTPFMRVLPIQFVSIGTMTAVMMLWYMYSPIAFCESLTKGATDSRANH